METSASDSDASAVHTVKDLPDKEINEYLR